MEVVITGNTSQFEQAMANARMSLEHLVACAVQGGEDIDAVIKSLSGQGVDGISTRMQSAIIGMEQSLSQLGASGDEVNAAKEKIVKALQEFSASSEDSTVKMEEMGKVTDEVLSGISEKSEELQESAGAAGASLAELAEKSAEMREGLENLNFKDFSEGNVEDVTAKLQEYKDVAEATADAAVKAYEKQGDVVEDLEKKLDDLNKQMEDPAKGEDEIRKLREEYEKLDEELKEAKECHEDLGKAVELAKERVVEATEGLDAWNKSVETAGNTDSFFKKVGDGVSNLTDKVKNWVTGNGKFKEGLDAFKDSLNQLPIPLGNAADGIMGMVQSMRVMLATPLGRALALITTALAALTSWFSKSTEGQMAFAKISGYVGSVVNSLTDIFIKLGEYIYKAFFTADGAMRNFASGLVKTLKSAVTTGVNLVQGLGEALKGIGQIFKGEFSEGWESIKSGAAKVAVSQITALQTVKNAWDTTIEGFKGALKMGQDGLGKLNSTDLMAAVKKMHTNAIEEGNLAVERKKTEQAISAEKENQARAEGEILEKRKQIEQLTGKEKLKAIAEAKDEQAKKLEERIKLQEKLVEIAKKQDGYHASNLADEEKLRKMNVDLLNLKKQQNAATLAMTKLEASTKRAMERSAASDAKKAAAEEKRQQKMTAAAAAAEGKLAEVIYAQELERLNQSTEMEEKIAEAKIAAMKDGAEKAAAQQEQQNKKELANIEKQKDAAIEAERKRQKAVFDAEQAIVKANGGTAGVWNDSMFDRNDASVKAIVEKFEELERLVAEKQKNIQQEAQSSAMRDYLKEYGTYEQKKLAITEEYEKKIAEAQTEGEKLSLGKKMQEALSDLKLDQLKKEIDWEYVFGDLDNIPLEILDDVNEKLRTFKDTAKELKPDEIKAVVEAMTKIETKLASTGSLAAARSASQERKTAQSNYDTSLAFAYAAKGDPEKEAAAYLLLIQRSKELTKAKKKEDDAWSSTEQTALNYAKALQEIGNFIGGTVGEVLNLGASAIQAGVAMVNGINQFKQAAGALQRSVAILAIIQAALQAIQIIGELFSEGEDQSLKAYVDAMDSYIKLLKEDIDDLNKAMGDTKNTMAETIELYKQYVELQKESAESIRAQSIAWLNSGASTGFLGTGIGSKSSEGVKIVKDIVGNLSGGTAETQAYFREIYNTLLEYAKKVGRDNLGRLDWIWNLTDDDMRKLAANQKVMSALGNELGESIRNYLNAIEQVNDSEGQLFGNLLAVDFDSFYDDFRDMISDMEVDSEDFANNFGAMIREALIRNMVAKDYESTLNELYNKIGEFANAGTLEEHIDELKKRYKDIADQARERIEEINEITGYETGINNEENNEENKSFLDTIRNSFQSLLSGSVDDIDAWAKNIRKAIATSVMEGLLLNGDYDTWAKGWGDAYSQLMNEYYSSVIDEEVYHQRLEALKEEFKTKTEEIENQAKNMMKEFEEDIASDTTFKAMTDSWVSALMDMNKTATDWSKDIGRIMAQKIIEQFVSASLIQPLLDNLQDAFNAAMGMEGATVQTVIADQGIAAALKDITDAYPDLKKISETVMSAFGLTGENATKQEEAKHALSNLKDTLVSGIMDINSTAADFGKNIGKTLIEQMVNQMVEKKYAKRIESIQQMWDGVLNGTSKNTINSVQREITRLYKAIDNETKELTEQLKEVIEAADPFEGMHSSLLSFLTDANTDIDTFMGNLQKTITSQLIDKYVLEGLDEQMALWNKQMKDIMDTGGSPEKIARDTKALMEQIAAYSEDRKQVADMWNELMGTDNTDYGDQQASVNMADKATYDQFEMYLGIATATMIGQEQGNAVRQQILQTLQVMGGITGVGGDFNEQMRSMMMLSTEYLLDIKRSNREILDGFGVKLDSINQKLSRL